MSVVVGAFVWRPAAKMNDDWNVGLAKADIVALVHSAEFLDFDFLVVRFELWLTTSADERALREKRKRNKERLRETGGRAPTRIRAIESNRSLLARLFTISKFVKH